MRFEQMIEELRATKSRKELMEISLEHGYSKMNLYMALRRMGINGNTTAQKLHETAEMLGYKVMYAIDNGSAMTRDEVIDRLGDEYKARGRGRMKICVEHGYVDHYLTHALERTRTRKQSPTLVLENVADMLGYELGYELVKKVQE